MAFIRSLSLLSICLILSACTAGRQIYVSMSYSTVPLPGTRVSVVANNMTVLSAAETWLRDRGLYVIEQGSAQTPTTPSSVDPCQERCKAAAALEAAKTAGADYVVLFQTSMEHAPERFSILINGFAAKAGKEVFSAEGTGFLDPEGLEEEDRNEALKNTLCHGLATIWQFRPGGYSDAKSNYCHISRPHA